MIEQKPQRRHGDTMAQMVFVASADLLTAWTTHTVSDSRLTTFSDADLEAADEAIFRGRPNIVVVEHRVAATAHGPEFIRRLQTDPGLAGLDVRVIDAETITSLTESPELARQALELLAEREGPNPARVRRHSRTELYGIWVFPDRVVDLTTFHPSPRYSKWVRPGAAAASPPAAADGSGKIKTG